MTPHDCYYCYLRNTYKCLYIGYKLTSNFFTVFSEVVMARHSFSELDVSVSYDFNEFQLQI